MKSYTIPPFLVVILFIFCCMACNREQKKTVVLGVAPRFESDPERRWKEEFDMLKNPYTGKIPRGIRKDELEEAAKMPLKEEVSLNAANSYVFQGPNSHGGRCRALAYDVRYNGTSNKVILAGGVSGGMFRSADGGLSWTRVSSLSDMHNVTCVAQDPRPGFEDTWYFGTGEQFGSSTSASGSAFYYGNGIYKSTDNGLTWSVLPSTAPGSPFVFDNYFDYVSKIVVDPATGHIYAGLFNSIAISTDGGLSWSASLGTGTGTTLGITDIVATSTGTIYASIPGRAGMALKTLQGIWRKSGGSWSRIAAPDSLFFNDSATLGRIVLAIAPSSEHLLYALYHNGITNSSCAAPVPEAEFGVFNETTDTWTNLSANLPDQTGCSPGNDPFAVQGGYDLVVAVKPDDASVVFIGGTNAYRSTDGFTTTTNTTKIGGYKNTSDYFLYDNHHPDIHAFAFNPANPDIMLTGSDGGIHEADITTPLVSWTPRNNDFSTFQYYYAAIDPTTGSDKYIGGTQDNGTFYRDAGTNTHKQIFGGDGVSAWITPSNTNHYVGAQSGLVYRRLSGLANGFYSGELTPAGLSSFRLFVTLFHLDVSNPTVLYYADYNELHRNTKADTVTTSALPADRMQHVTGVATAIGATNIRSFATTWGPYSSATSKLYFGTSNGKVFRLDDPRDCAPGTAPVQINLGAGMPVGVIMGLAVNPRSPDTLLAVYSNYGITSIWFCGDATSASPTWTAIEGDLSLPSIRSACIVTGAAGDIVEYYVGTSTGLYSTTALSGGTTSWLKEGAGTIGNALITDLKLRPADNKMLVATHGNGLFVTDVILPVRMASLKGHIVKNKTLLQWETYSETNNKGFEIQKSADGQLFSQIGFVDGKGNSTTKNSYQFTDPAILQRVQYYRLRQTDYNGRVAYSQVVKITNNGQPLALAYLVNPASTNLIFRLNDIPKSRVQVTITDQLGRTVMSRSLKGNEVNTFNLNIINLDNGIYFLRIETEGLKETRKFIKRN